MSDGTIIFGTITPYLLAYNKDGKQLWKIKLFPVTASCLLIFKDSKDKDGLFVETAVEGLAGDVYVCAKDSVFRIEIKTGRLVFVLLTNVSLGKVINSIDGFYNATPSLVDKDGMLFVCGHSYIGCFFPDLR